MSRHIADSPRTPSPSRPARYLDIARRNMTHPNVEALRSRPRETTEAQRLLAYVDQARAAAQPEGRHVADGPREGAEARAARYLEIARREGLHPAIAALHSRSRDSAAVARTRAFLRQAQAEATGTGAHVADGPRTPAPSRPARYLELARAQNLHPSVRALRTRRGDATALIRLREFLRIARGDTA